MDMGVIGWSRRSGHVLRFFWRILSEKIDVGLVAEDAVAFIAGGFDKDAEAGEAGDQIVSGGVGGACERLDIGDGDDGTLVEGFEDAESVSGSAPQSGGHGGAVVFAQCEDAACGLSGLTADLGDAAQEECQPLLPLPVIAHGLKALVVFGAVALEEVGEIENRLEEDLALAEQEGDEQASDATVTVQKRVNRLELDMGKADLHELG